MPALARRLGRATDATAKPERFGEGASSLDLACFTKREGPADTSRRVINVYFFFTDFTFLHTQTMRHGTPAFAKRFGLATNATATVTKARGGWPPLVFFVA